VVDLPIVPDFHDGLAGAVTNLAKLHNERGQFGAALGLLEEARPHLQTAVTAIANHPGFRESQRECLVALGQSHLGRADHAQVAATVDELERFGFEPAKGPYDAACLLARCTTLVQKDALLAELKRKELAQSYADRAMALLRQSVARGYKDAAHMKKDPDLEPLRARQEFHKLLAKLEGK
jgi:hypothetical protein